MPEEKFNAFYATAWLEMMVRIVINYVKNIKRIYKNDFPFKEKNYIIIKIETRLCWKFNTEKPLSDFYHYNKKCKRCCNSLKKESHNKLRENKPRKFGGLSIRADIDLGIKLVIVAKKDNIKYPSLFHWNKIKAL